MSTYRHDMPFGAEVMPDGQVRFRLWAPHAAQVDLVLEPIGKPRQLIPLERGGGGWFEQVSRSAGVGSRYRYRINGGALVPDPASRCNPLGVHGPSEVIDPSAFEWTDSQWRAPPWAESVVYELHVGTFAPPGTFAAVEDRLEHLKSLGVTAIELMPVAEFAGGRGWGYDGVLPFAPASAYGGPAALKSLIAAAHAVGLAVMLDVVYNHFGPEGNYLHLYAPEFFTTRHATPWGAAIDFESSEGAAREGSRGSPVRDFFVHNALYWLEEFHLDGLRLDAVHAIHDDSRVHILTEMVTAVRRGPGRERVVYLVLENLANEAHRLGPPGGRETFDAQWNDDFHHSVHVLLTGEQDGYYSDFTEQPHALLARCLAEGFAFQGEWSTYEGTARGEPSASLPPSAFVNFLQNHDQVGNRAQGERLSRLAAGEEPLRAAAALLLLAPSPPLLFMGEEWSAPEPFTYFCDFEPELAEKVRAGRRREFAQFIAHRGGALPDPADEATWARARLNWERLTAPGATRMLAHYTHLLQIRRAEIVPRLADIVSGSGVALGARGALAVDWALRDGGVLHLVANLAQAPAPVFARIAGRRIFETHAEVERCARAGKLVPWSVLWMLEEADGGR